MTTPTAVQHLTGKSASSARKCFVMKNILSHWGIGYKTVADVINGFIHLGQLPVSLSQFVGTLGWWRRDFRQTQSCGISNANSALFMVLSLIVCIHATDDAEPVTNADESVESEGISCPKTPRLICNAWNVAAPTTSTDSICFFCDDSGSDLYQVLTFAVDVKVHRCATVLGDNILSAKLAKGGMIATDAKYHLSYRLSLYYKFMLKNLPF